MSLKNELIASKKLSFDFQRAVARLDDNVNPDTPLFSAAVQTSEEGIRLDNIAGVTIGMTVGDIQTVRSVSLNGLKSLIDNEDVISIQGARPLRRL
jgi:hypothetical protein